MIKGYGYTKMSIAEMFDRLSIIEVKIFNRPIEKEKLIIQKQEQQEDINNTIGYDLAKEIYCSPEYMKLYNENFNLFSLVDLVKKEDKQSVGYKIDQGVYSRFLAKKELQNKFFSEELNEVKVGYS